MKLEEIKRLLKEHNYLADKTIDIDAINTYRQYEFVCDFGHVFTALASHVIRHNGFGCPICSGHRVLKGFNDMWTTHPEIACMLKNPEDGYKYTAHSNVELVWVCPDCKNERTSSPNKMLTRKRYCNQCNRDASYPEKFVSCLLDQYSICYEREKIFEWSNNKRYDFYLPLYNCIVEVHGKQHYTNSTFSYLGGKSLFKEQNNDEKKKCYAMEEGAIEYYIVIDCRKSEVEWISKSVIQSGLLEVVHILPDIIDWNECHEYAMSNLSKQICELYESGKSIKELCELFLLSYNSIKTKLKQGAAIGWCSYDPKEAIEKRNKENGRKIVEDMSKPVVQMNMHGEDICEYPSIQEAQRKLKISHIWDCVVGKRNCAGGYKWRYKNAS